MATIRYGIDFGRNVVTWRGARVQRRFHFKTDVQCHHFSLKGQIREGSSTVEVVPGKTVKEDWLFGPATSLKSRCVIYPCSRHRCALPCPCRICRKINPKCHHPEVCSCKDCMLNFDDHSRFHSVFHLGCKFCGQILQVVPHFNFYFVSREQRRLSIGKDDFDYKSGGFCFAAGGPKISVQILENLRYGILQDIWLCRDCKIVFWSDSQLRNHIERKHLGLKVFDHVYIDSAAVKTVGDGFKCYNCSDIFKSSKSLCRHIELVHHQESYKCELCSKGFTRRDALKRHKEVAHPAQKDEDDGVTKQSYKCNLCSALFSRRDNLTRHLKRKHSTVDNVSLSPDVHHCEVCDQTFKRKYHLARHVREKHKAVEFDNFKCCDCGKSFTRAEDLKRHTKVHKSDNCVKCNHCDTQFSEKANLMRHKKGAVYGIHHFPKFTCMDCAKYFCTGKAMKGHKCDKLLLTDKSDIPILCNKCNEVFTSKRALQVHVKNSKDFSCKQCSMVLCNLNSLTKHCYIHNVELIMQADSALPVKKESGTAAPVPESTLHSSVQDLVNLICNFQTMESVEDEGLHQVDKRYKQLDVIIELLDKNSEQ